MTDDLSYIPGKVPLEQFDIRVLGKEKIREFYRAGKLPTPEMLIDEIVLRAVKAHANDIHFEPAEGELRIRIGHEGILKPLVSLPKEIAENLANVLKTKASMNAFDKKKPQEGRYSVAFGQHQFDIRISTIPITTGERIALRLLHKTARVANMEELGFSKENMERFRILLKRPSGLLLIVGPSGAGKSTTLYAAINDMRSDERNIITVENPVEYRLDFASQVQFSPDKTFTMHEAIRAVLRQEPNTIMVGEIRDGEIGSAAAEAALTGNLVLSSMLSGDAIGAIPRLLNLGISPYWLATTLVGIVYQQLVRKVCTSCKETYSPTTEEIALLSGHTYGISTVARGKGCEACKGTGYDGRTAVHEIVIVNDYIRDLIYQQDSILKLKGAALEAGFENIRIDAAKKVASGVVSVAEFARALG
jgi:type II secretory ATPase GspE/PulE/Tfp pilus assembly ATPase PilB-like protein